MGRLFEYLGMRLGENGKKGAGKMFEENFGVGKGKKYTG